MVSEGLGARSARYKIGWWILVVIAGASVVNHISGPFLGFASGDDEVLAFLGLAAMNIYAVVVLLTGYRRGERWAWWVTWVMVATYASKRSIDEQCTRTVMKAVAQRIIHLTEEIKVHEKTLRSLVKEAAPQLLEEFGVGPVTAAALYVAWSHPGRCRNEAAYARLAGVAPIPANSGQTQDRHRLNRGGDRQLNKALHTIAVTRIRAHPKTQTYKQRRLAEGKTDREIRRCIKRYIARKMWRLLERPQAAEKGA